MTTSADSFTRALPPLEHPLEDGWTLPATWYSDTAVAERERELIFARSWQYAGPAEYVAEPGSFASTQIGHIPIVITRARDGVLRAFINVCRHRAYVIAREHGCRETLQCPYHAWTYNLDGSLKKVPRSEREEDFNPENFSLLPASVDTWGPFLFVNPDPDAAPLAETLGDLPRIVAGSRLNLRINMMQQVMEGRHPFAGLSVQQRVDNFLFHFRNTPCTATGLSPAEIMLKKKPQTKLGLLKPSVRGKFMEKKDAQEEGGSSRVQRSRSFQVGQTVWVKTLRREDTGWQLGEIKKRLGLDTYLVDTAGRIRMVHADQLREHRFPARTSEEITFSTDPSTNEEQRPEEISRFPTNSPPRRSPRTPIRTPVRRSQRTIQAPKRLDL